MSGTEVRSPVSRRGSAVGSGQSLSPGARSNPSRGDAGGAAAGRIVLDFRVWPDRPLRRRPPARSSVRADTPRSLPSWGNSFYPRRGDGEFPVLQFFRDGLRAVQAEWRITAFNGCLTNEGLGCWET